MCLVSKLTPSAQIRNCWVPFTFLLSWTCAIEYSKVKSEWRQSTEVPSVSSVTRCSAWVPGDTHLSVWQSNSHEAQALGVRIMLSLQLSASESISTGNLIISSACHRLFLYVTVGRSHQHAQVNASPRPLRATSRCTAFPYGSRSCNADHDVI
jgi:hypothetical protein